MKMKLLPVLLMSLAIASCTKDRNPSRDQKILLARTTTVSGGSTTIDEYSYDDLGRITQIIYAKGSPYEGINSFTYDAKGNIAVEKLSADGIGRVEYAYDNMNRMVSQQKYMNDGSKDYKNEYAYYNDRVENMRTSRYGTVTKQVFTYTSDKKNVLTFTWYNEDGSFNVQITYTPNNIKDPYRTTGPIGAFSNYNLTDKDVIMDYSDGPAPTIYGSTYIYTANADGYPISCKESNNNGGPVHTTTTYEYIKK